MLYLNALISYNDLHLHKLLEHKNSVFNQEFLENAYEIPSYKTFGPEST